jgi:hypothetical protein
MRRLYKKKRRWNIRRLVCSRQCGTAVDYIGKLWAILDLSLPDCRLTLLLIRVYANMCMGPQRS